MYQIRVAARMASTGRDGLVLADTVVPRRARGRPLLSGVAVTTSRAARAVSTGPAFPFGALTGPPTTQRTFVRGDVLTAAVQVCPPQRKPDAPVLPVASVGLGADREAVVWSATTEANADAASACGAATITVPTESLAPGMYVLRMGVPGEKNVERVVPVKVVAQ